MSGQEVLNFLQMVFKLEARSGKSIERWGL